MDDTEAKAANPEHPGVGIIQAGHKERPMDYQFEAVDLSSPTPYRRRLTCNGPDTYRDVFLLKVSQVRVDGASAASSGNINLHHDQVVALAEACIDWLAYMDEIER